MAADNACDDAPAVITMIRRIRPAVTLVLALLWFSLTACTVVAAAVGPDPTEAWPTPLPSAVPPESPPEVWALSYEYSFPPQFWSLGRHNYRLRVDCPELGFIESESVWRSFSVFEDAPGLRPTIYLRQIGLSTRPLGDPDRYYIHPDQLTLASVTFLGLGREQAEGLAASPHCGAMVTWDDGAGALRLSAGEPHLP